MRLPGRIFALLASLALTAPAAAQTYYGGPTYRGQDVAPRGQYGGPARGGSYGRYPGRGFRIGPGILLPAIAAGAAAAAAAQAEEDDAPPPRHPRRPPHLQHEAHKPPPRHPAVKPPVKRVVEKPAPEKPPVAVVHAALDLPAKGETRFVAKEALVVFKPGTSDKAIAGVLRRQKLENVQFRDFALLNQRVYRLRWGDDRTLNEVLSPLARERAVASVQPDYLYALAEDSRPVSQALATPNAPAAGASPPTSPAGATPAPPLKTESPALPPTYAPAMLHLPEAHKIARGEGVRVALIDAAIDPSHPELQGSVAATFDASGAAAAPSRHGVGMAGAIVGHKLLDGAAPLARLLAARAFDDAAEGAKGVEFDLLAALDWATAQQARVVNMSFTGPNNPLLAQMLAAAAAKRIVLIAAAGNDGPQASPAFPGADPHVIAVSAIDDQSRLYDHANRGAYVALAAPGVDVLVAAPGGAYDLTSGTSVACAEVSGIAALLLERRPDLDGPALRQVLRASARALKTAPEAGAGLADAQAALRDGGEKGTRNEPDAP